MKIAEAALPAVVHCGKDRGVFMQFRLSSIAAVLATMAVTMSANAALTTYAPWAAYWPTANGAGQGIDNVLFNVQSAGGVTVAMGAHGYKNSEFLPNNGVDTYYALAGTYPGEPNRANWSFDLAWDLGGCTTCSVALKVDTDPTAGVNLVTLLDLPVGGVPDDFFASWNMEMDFGGPSFAGVPGNALQGTYNFNPFAASSTDFSLVVTNTAGSSVSSNITVAVPEPGSLALAGLALAGLALARRRHVG
jgi:PEP-CTERM motif